MARFPFVPRTLERIRVQGVEMLLSWEILKAINDSNVTPHWLPQFCETSEPHIIPPIPLDTVLRSRRGILFVPLAFFWRRSLAFARSRSRS